PPPSSYLPSHPHPVLLYFSLSLSAHHRDLHSFPTRRSSDLRIDPLLAVSRLQPEGQDPQGVDLPPVPEQLEDTEREEPAVHVLQRLVEVGEREREPDGFAVDLRDRAKARVDHRPELPGQMVELRIGHRHEPPVALPGAVVDVLDPRDLAREVLQVQRAQFDPLRLPQAFDSPYQ